MNHALSQKIFGAVDDTARSALMLMLAGAAISLLERSGSQRQASRDTDQVVESLQRAAKHSTAQRVPATRGSVRR
jgi:hypothetical protein